MSKSVTARFVLTGADKATADMQAFGKAGTEATKQVTAGANQAVGALSALEKLKLRNALTLADAAGDKAAVQSLKDQLLLQQQLAAFKRAGLNTGDATAAARAQVAGLQAIRGAANEAGVSLGNLNRMQFMELGHSARAVVDMMIAGASPMRAIEMEAPRLAQTLGEGNGGVGASFKMLAGLITPARLALLGVAGVIATGAAAAVSYVLGQEQIANALATTGRASGLTRDDVNALAEQVSAAGEISTGAAAKMATAYASAGVQGKDNIAGLVQATKDYAAVTGTDLVKAQEALGKAFADPKAGAEQLNTQLHMLTDAQMQHITQLADENRLQEAQSELLRALQADVDGAAHHVHGLAAAWDTVATSAANAMRTIGQTVARMAGFDGGPPKGFADDATKAALQSQLTAARQAKARGQRDWTIAEPSGDFAGLTVPVDQLIKNLEDKLGVTAQAARQRQDAERYKAVSASAGDAIRSNNPEVALLARLQGEYANLNEASKNGWRGVDAQAARLGPATLEGVQRAIKSLTDSGGKIASPQARRIRISEIDKEMAGLGSKDSARKTALGVEKARLEEAGKVMTQGEADAKAAASGAKAGSGGRDKKDRSQQIADAGEQAIDQATKDELNARLALVANIMTAAELRKGEIDADTTKRVDKLRGDVAEGKISAAAGAKALALEQEAAREKKALIDREARDRVEAQALQHAQAIAGEQEKLASIQASLAHTAADRADLERRSLEQRQQLEIADLQRQARADHDPANAGYWQQRLGAAQARQAAERKQQGLTSADAIAKERASVADGQLNAELEMLRSVGALARTSAQRRDSELRILAIQQQLERAKLEEVLNSKTASDAEKTIAQAQLDLLPDKQAADREKTVKATMGPMEKWKDGLIQSAGEAREALQQVEVDGLDGLNQGLVDAAVNAKSFGDAMSAVLKQVESDLLRLMLRMAENQLFNGGGAGGGGGFGSILNLLGMGGSGGVSYASIPGDSFDMSSLPDFPTGAKDGGLIAHMAAGGAVRGPGTSRSDSIPVHLSEGEWRPEAA